MQHVKPLKEGALGYLGQQVAHGDRSGIYFLAAHPTVCSFRHDLPLLRSENAQVGLFYLRRKGSKNAKSIKNRPFNVCFDSFIFWKHLLEWPRDISKECLSSIM